MAITYWLEVSQNSNSNIYLRVYMVSPWEYPGAGSIGALKRIDFETRELNPVKIKYNVQIGDCTIDHALEIIDWQKVVTTLAVQLDNRVADKVQLKPGLIEEIAGQFIDEAKAAGWGIVEVK